ncbi:hypothetical protein DRQ17_00505 [bacterium]|nr:MAG: hypothetical protein DRQ17_00505 [bacterium]
MSDKGKKMRVVREAILEFLSDVQVTFAGADLVRYVKTRVFQETGRGIYDDTILRELRRFREQGKIGYVCIDFPHSMYKITHRGI